MANLIEKSLIVMRNHGFKHFIRVVYNRLAWKISLLRMVKSTKRNNISSLNDFKTLHEDSLVIVTGVPYDDIGGGQRASQLARCALKSGRKVIYLYLYQKYSMEKGGYVPSDVKVPGLEHLYIDECLPKEILTKISKDSTVLVELPHPKVIPFIQAFNVSGVKTVFELIDNWDSSLGAGWYSDAVLCECVKKADVVVGTAKVLVDRLIEMGRNDAIYLPNAANEYIFDKYRKYNRPSDLDRSWNRVALYFGSLYGEWFDWDSLLYSAEQNPDIHFVLIGEYKIVDSFPVNIHFLGAKSIDELPAYLAFATFCLLPFKVGKISDAVSPIKIFEYLFLGKEVVSNFLPEIVDYPGVHLVSSKEEFSETCKKLAASCTVGSANFDNDIFISHNSWFSRLDELIRAKNTQNAEIVSVIVLIHNNKPIIGRFLKTLFDHCSPYLKEVIVVDNNSSDGGGEWVKEHFPECVVIKNFVNGCSSGRNLGIARARGQVLAFFDSDQWFTSSIGFSEALSLLSKANVGAVGWTGGWISSSDDLSGPIVDYLPHRGIDITVYQNGYRADLDYLGSGGLFILKKQLHHLRGFDENLDPTCFEDTDFSFSIREMGLDLAYRDLVGIRHQPHQTTKASAQSKEYLELFHKNMKYMKEKWKNSQNMFR